MSLESNKAMARRYFEAYSAGNIDAVMKFMDTDYVLHPGGGGKPMGFDERKRDESIFFSAFSDIQAVVEDQVAEGDKVVNRITMYCTQTGKYQGIAAAGKRIVIPYMDIVTIRAGKIVEEWVEYDTMNILEQIKPH